ncbi:unnamed protein product, partial [Staurois parvus]
MIGAQQCHPPAPPTCAQQCHPPVPLTLPSSAAISAAYQCCLSVPIISAAYPCHLISAAYQCPSVLPHQRTSVKEKNYLFAKFYNRNKEKFFFSNFFALFLFI